MPEKEYVPVDVVRVTCDTPVAGLVSVIVASTTAAPVGSVTVPVMPPVSTCAAIGRGASIAIKDRHTAKIALLLKLMRIIGNLLIVWPPDKVLPWVLTRGGLASIH